MGECSQGAVAVDGGTFQSNDGSDTIEILLITSLLYGSPFRREHLLSIGIRPCVVRIFAEAVDLRGLAPQFAAAVRRQRLFVACD